MEQLSFNFMDDAKQNDHVDNVYVSNEQLLKEANELAYTYLSMSGIDALYMIMRGDLCDTDLEGTLLHSKLKRIAYLLNMY